uniref:U-actitoxin-Ave venom kunitz potassium channel toxin type 2 n=1 Tax=Aulactinia veratra TaxID=1730095 RepID=A0A3P8MJV4_AULVR|nr:U-actitoxin-Ave venom kunitz potassium channel toxin type 2 [Aulactinia veratra]
MAKSIVFVLCLVVMIGFATSKPEYCNAPLLEGSCGGGFTRYYYNSETGQCQEFLYGGCRGNENNFATNEECMETCA